MRKILFSIIIILLLLGAGLTIANGLELGNFHVWGINAFVAENENIEKKNQELSDLVSVTYPNSIEQLNTASNTLDFTKKEYEDKAVLISNSKYYMQTEKYEIEFLWTKLGNYAQDNNVQIKIDVVNSGTAGLYDLNFTIAGEYKNVTQFIYDVENDSKLGFKIEGFNMASIEGVVQGTFSCKEISINIDTIETPESDEKTESNAESDVQTGTNEVTEEATT